MRRRKRPGGRHHPRAPNVAAHTGPSSRRFPAASGRAGQLPGHEKNRRREPAAGIDASSGNLRAKQHNQVEAAGVRPRGQSVNSAGPPASADLVLGVFVEEPAPSGPRISNHGRHRGHLPREHQLRLNRRPTARWRPASSSTPDRGRGRVWRRPSAFVPARSRGVCGRSPALPSPPPRHGRSRCAD